MAKQSTSERILDVALELFSVYGFKAVSMEMIATGVGIKAPSLYKHYSGKTELFNRIIKLMESSDESSAEKHDVPKDSIKVDEKAYKSVDIESLCEFSKDMFDYWTVNTRQSCFRRLLLIEKNKDENMAKLFNQYLCMGPLEYLEDIFSNYPFVDDPKKAALNFYSPMFFCIEAYDSYNDKSLIRKMAVEHLDLQCTELLALKRRYEHENGICEE
ncbi:MAG: TetR/AcrR family transcriptional regulator [Succinivibrio sp.]